ncbi:CopG family transcriptional regulator [Pectobacteriaceae bacterium CE70]|nr:CopG family transcriptional regulator [Pectobacteriaceae bacterium C52]WJV63009.1 CopG family transcriptional regulator [Pectobacteriaceae bacterium C52]WJV67338.1 CopG family transcriptional regulator [Pectobacteriaceae bacterium CE70]WJY11318.1 CopG family transcriptional regulator [Pectobacteriaceae bacterium C80]
MKKTKKPTVALTSLIKEEQRHQRVLQGLDDADAGRVVNYADIQAFIARLKQA